MDPKKVQAVENWEVLKKLKEVHAFLGLADFYQWFIQIYSRVVQPLT
jgi:hypothetical protein